VAGAIDGVFQRTTVADLAERHQRTAGPTVFTSEQLLSGLNETASAEEVPQAPLPA
jgi:hypothetical protein